MKMGDRALNGPFVVATRRVVGLTVVRLCCPSQSLWNVGLLVPMVAHVKDLRSEVAIRRVVRPTVGPRPVEELGHPADPGMGCGGMELMRAKPKNSRPLTI
jgi:hypothetical protein